MSLFKRKNDEENWLSVSDLMAGLMMVFLFISIIYSKDAEQRSRNVTEVVNEWQDNEVRIYNALTKEFKNDLVRWNAEIEKETLLIRFNSPEVLFQQGEAKLQEKFKVILQDFMPRFLNLLHSKFKENISEVRIEGHTSSDWKGKETKEAFIKNMELSQERTRKVLEYSLNLKGVDKISDWTTKTLSANGLSSSKLILEKKGDLWIENKQASRRVDFAIRTKTKEALFRILDKISGGGIDQGF
tara:strand:- start:3264 stop:3992 length:729 start_codon:yes stop_codon:yes gene_type:complete